MTLALVGSAGFEAPLCDELVAAGASGARVMAPGVVACDWPEGRARGDLVFARQVLPDARIVRGESVAALARAAVGEVLPSLGEHGWRLDAFALDPELASRAALIEQVFLEELKARRRRVLRARVPGPAAPRVVQLLLASRVELLTSVAEIAALPRGGVWPSPFAGGRVVVADDWTAPSSAFRKLEEALAWLGRDIAPGERCVDLGAAPGGWSHVALGRGGSVIAVDRADLHERVAAHPHLRHVVADAFSFVPEATPVDWLLCDVIAAPERSLALLERWVSERWCKHLVLHLKFKGGGQYGLVRDALALLGGFPVARAKHLAHDRNEVTLMACS